MNDFFWLIGGIIGELALIIISFFHSNYFIGLLTGLYFGIIVFELHALKLIPISLKSKRSKE